MALWRVTGVCDNLLQPSSHFYQLQKTKTTSSLHCETEESVCVCVHIHNHSSLVVWGGLQMGTVPVLLEKPSRRPS